ncbi:MAG: BamA/TamA family outer membrane protein [Candidatus Zixiibacteriota bacterium]
MGIALDGVPACAETGRDTTAVRPPRRTDRNAIEYVLALPSIALKIPVRVTATLVSAPIIIVERNTLLPTLERWFSFVDFGGLQPIAGYGSTPGLEGGLSYHHRHVFGRGIGLGVQGSYSTNLYRQGSVRFGGKQWLDSRYGFMAEFGWQGATRERFYGIGASSSIDNESNYGFEGRFGSATGFWHVRPGLEATVKAGLRRIDPEDGRLRRIEYQLDSISLLYPDDDLFGLFETVDLYEFGFEVRHDWRDRPGSPLRGGTELIAVSYVTGSSQDDTDIGYWRAKADLSHYLNLYRGRAIGVRTLAEVTEPDDGTRVPFYELSRLGGGSRLRGYRSDRFTDRDLALFTIEYRWPLWQRMDAFLFTDQGRVFANLEKDFEFSNFRSSYGGGLRVWNTSGGTVEFSIAQGAETTRFYFDFGAAF